MDADLGQVSGGQQPVPVAGCPASVLRLSAETSTSDEIDSAGLALVARAGRALSGSLDVASLFQALARLLVPSLGDWCSLTAVEADGSLRRVAVSAGDPSVQEVAEAVTAGLPPATGIDTVVNDVLASGRAELRPELAGDDVSGLDEHQRAGLRRLGYRSLMCVPLLAGDRAVGAATVMSGEAGRPHQLADLALAEDVANLAAGAIERALHHRQVLESEQRLRALVDGLGAIVWEADASTMAFTFVSRRAEEVLGYPVRRWVEEPDFWVGMLHPEDRDYALSYRRVATGEARDHEIEYRLVGADGRTVWVQDIVQAQSDEHGTALRLRGVMVDVTPRKRVEKVLLQSRERFASLARTLQASLLPPDLPDIAGVEVAARYRPAEDGAEVVGDFYDLFEVGNDGWGVVIGDVCGKGPDAAALTAVARHTVRAAAMRERHPSRVLRALNQAVLHHDSDERFCTAVYARLVPVAGGVRLSMSCGGHPLPLLLRADGSVETVGRPGTLLGAFDAPELGDVDVELGPGDSVVFFTDGATEAKRRGTVLGDERLKAIVAACAGLHADEIASRMEDAIVTFQEGAPQDDLAIVVLRVSAGTNGT